MLFRNLSVLLSFFQLPQAARLGPVNKDSVMTMKMVGKQTIELPWSPDEEAKKWIFLDDANTKIMLTAETVQQPNNAIFMTFSHENANGYGVRVTEVTKYPRKFRHQSSFKLYEAGYVHDRVSLAGPADKNNRFLELQFFPEGIPKEDETEVDEEATRKAKQRVKELEHLEEQQGKSYEELAVHPHEDGSIQGPSHQWDFGYQYGPPAMYAHAYQMGYPHYGSTYGPLNPHGVVEGDSQQYTPIALSQQPQEAYGYPLMNGWYHRGPYSQGGQGQWR